MVVRFVPSSPIFAVVSEFCLFTYKAAPTPAEPPADAFTSKPLISLSLFALTASESVSTLTPLSIWAVILSFITLATALPFTEAVPDAPPATDIRVDFFVELAITSTAFFVLSFEPFNIFDLTSELPASTNTFAPTDALPPYAIIPIIAFATV